MIGRFAKEVEVVPTLVKEIHQKVSTTVWNNQSASYIQLDFIYLITCKLPILSPLFSGVALTQLGGITSTLREKTRLTGSNAQNKKQYQEYQNTIASQNAGKLNKKFWKSINVLSKSSVQAFLS